MYQNETVTQEHVVRTSLKYVAIIGSAMAFAIWASMTVVQADATDTQPPSDSVSAEETIDMGALRHNEANGDFRDCTVDYGGTPSCAVSLGQPPVENFPSTT